VRYAKKSDPTGSLARLWSGTKPSLLTGVRIFIISGPGLFNRILSERNHRYALPAASYFSFAAESNWLTGYRSFFIHYVLLSKILHAQNNNPRESLFPGPSVNRGEAHLHVRKFLSVLQWDHSFLQT
jgi:hypothetical protein